MRKELTQEQIVAKYTRLDKMAQDLGLRTKLDNGFCIFQDSRMIECLLTVDELEAYLNGYKAAQMYAASLR